MSDKNEEKEIQRVKNTKYEHEIRDYFQRRQDRLKVVKTTYTPSGQTIDWIPIESQHFRGEIATPPPTDKNIKIDEPLHNTHSELLAIAELEVEGVERGPEGTVPILRKKLEALDYTKSLKEFLSKPHGQRLKNDFPPPEPDGNHRYASSMQSITCFGGEGQFSCFDPFLESPDDFSLIQIGLTNNDLGFLQSVEAGWQEFKSLTGDWVPHLFTFYTTNGYKDNGDKKGGYNTDVDGWIQYDNIIFPGTTFTPYSQLGGEQRKITIKYQLYEGNWWLRCQDRWVGYYPSSLFMGNQSVFRTLGDHADHIGFWGEVFDSDDKPGRTTSDMGSGHFPNEGWTWSAYMHNLLVQKNRDGTLAEYDGSRQLFESDPDMYKIEAHFNSRTNWGSYVYVGGPGAK